MALCNDNFWGYTTDILYKYQVTWLEAAIVQPCWTTMMVCYVEGDEGHLLGEKVNQQQYRTRVRGTAHSFAMPWQDIVNELKKQSENAAASLKELPRRPEQLRYVLRVSLRVQRREMDRVLRKLAVRPYVLVKLLEYLIDHNHVVFRGRGAPRDLKQQMADAVSKWYAVDAGQDQLPQELRSCDVSEHVLEEQASSDAEGNVAKRSKESRSTLLKEKSSTPGSGFNSAENIFEETRPATVSAGNSTQSHSDPGTMRIGAHLRHGELRIQTGKELIAQWHGKYFS